MVDLYLYKEEKNQLLKHIVWRVINHTLFRCLIGNGYFMSVLKNSILNLFGAKNALKSRIYSSCTIWNPWNLELGEYSVLGPNTNIYNKDKIIIGRNTVISQGAYLCSASHDISDPLLKLVTAPIIIEDNCWIAADAFIGKGVFIGEGAVIAARSCVIKDVESWTVVGGNPAKFIKKRILQYNKNCEYEKSNNSNSDI